MIIDNYTNTLPENKRSNIDFLDIESPTLNIRMFEYNLVREVTHLILPYYVGDSDGKDYTEEKISPTFTTVFMFDEDKLPQDQITVIKRTTYAGEQVIDFGAFAEEGIHSLSVYTIQNNGVSSPTRFLQFIVRKPESEYTVVDLTKLSTFNSSVTDHKRYYTPAHNAGDVYASVYTRSYMVSIDSTGDINVTVNRPSGSPWHTIYTVNRRGGALGSQVGSDALDNCEVLDYELMKNQSNQVTYRLTEKCVISGVEHNLKDYVGYTGVLPDEVIRAGVENKLALMYLFEAAKAVDETGTVKLILPKMDIVCDYHFADITKDIRYLGGLDVCRSCLHLPDGIIIDLNESTVSVLPTSYHISGRLFYGLYNTDTHIVNGNIVGNWGNSTLIRKDGINDGEHRSVVLFQGCRFCSIEDLDVSYTVGYDVTCGSEVSGLNLWDQIQFGDLGYIDYSGNEHHGSAQDNSILGYRLSTGYHEVHTKVQPFCAPVFLLHIYGSSGSAAEKILTKTCRTVFIHFYDENNRFIKTVKASQQWYILVPYGAVKAKISMFGTINTGDGASTPDFLMQNNYRRFCVYIMVPSWCCSTERCKIHDTRQCVLLIGGVQNRVKDCLLYNIGAERQAAGNVPSGSGTYYSTLEPTDDYDAFAIYKRLVQIEESAWYSFHTFWENVECLYSDGAMIRMDGSRDMHIKNCHGISFSFGYPVVDYLMEGCSYQMFRSHSWMSGPSHSVIRNCILKSIDNGGDSVSQSSCLGAGKYSGDLYLRNCDVLNEEGVLPIHDEPNIKS